MLLRILRFM